jgi:hypothetical protein
MTWKDSGLTWGSYGECSLCELSSLPGMPGLGIPQSCNHTLPLILQPSNLASGSLPSVYNYRCTLSQIAVRASAVPEFRRSCNFFGCFTSAITSINISYTSHFLI